MEPVYENTGSSVGGLDFAFKKTVEILCFLLFMTLVSYYVSIF